MKPNLPRLVFEEANRIYDEIHFQASDLGMDASEAQEYADDAYDKFIVEQYAKYEELYKTISSKQMGKAIRRARGEANLTQMELSEQLGIVQSTLSRYERGKLEPSFSDMARVSLLLFDSMDMMIEQIILEGR